jgi:hypothetical protein
MDCNPLAHPEDWADHIIIIPSNEKFLVCTKCLNKNMNPSTCPGTDKCILTKGMK